MIKKTFAEKGIAYASELAPKNVQDLLTIADWNLTHGFGLFRISSDLFPWALEYRITSLSDYTEIRVTFDEIGACPIRLTTHPGPFNHLAGQGKVLNNTIADLDYQSEVFDLMGLIRLFSLRSQPWQPDLSRSFRNGIRYVGYAAGIPLFRLAAGP